MFCDFCHVNCGACNNGHDGMYHAETEDGRWICDCCFEYDMCIRATTPDTVDRPCEDVYCIHRPRIVGDWLEFKI